LQPEHIITKKVRG